MATVPAEIPSSATTTRRSFAPTAATLLSLPVRLLNRPAGMVPWLGRLTVPLWILLGLHLLRLLRQPTTRRLMTLLLARRGTIHGSHHHTQAALPPRHALAGPAGILLLPPSLKQHALQASTFHFRLFLLHKLGPFRHRPVDLLDHLQSFSLHASPMET